MSSGKTNDGPKSSLIGKIYALLLAMFMFLLQFSVKVNPRKPDQSAQTGLFSTVRSSS